MQRREWLEVGESVGFDVPASVRAEGGGDDASDGAAASRAARMQRRLAATPAEPRAATVDATMDTQELDASDEAESPDDGSAARAGDAFEMIGDSTAVSAAMNGSEPDVPTETPDATSPEGDGEADATSPEGDGEADAATPEDDEGTEDMASSETTDEPTASDASDSSDGTEETTPAEGGDRDETAASTGGAFEMIGEPSPTQDDPSTASTSPPTDEGDDAAAEDPTDAAEVASADDDDMAETAEPASSDDSLAPLPATSETTEIPPFEVRVVGVRESYAQRRLWDVVDVHSERPWVLEERRLMNGEDPALAASLVEIDRFSDRWLFNPVARRVHDDRLLTLFEAPRGESLESWRRRLGRDATASSIIDVLRPVARAVDAIHANERLHLHLNPRTIWVTEDGDVGFTGVDVLEEIPVRRTRFRATIGFSAPELFGRSVQDIHKAADIYSLGAITYYLISGVIPPVAPETAFAPAIAPRDFRPAFPIGWSELVLRATDPVPSRRFESAETYLAAIERGFEQMLARLRQSESVHIAAMAERHIGYAKALRSPVNQDNTFLAQDRERARLLVTVADGVSTATFGSGDLASGFLATRSEEMWQQILSGEHGFEPESVILDIVSAANRDIVDYVNQRHGPLDAAPSEVMGSTGLVATIDNGLMTLGALGDSRCYIIRDELMECVTRDHNLFTLSLIEGLPIEEVLMMPHGDALARCLGTFDVDRDGYLDPVDPPVDIYQFRVMPGDSILLCTDGLFDYAGSTYEESEANIRSCVLSENHPGIACLELITLANRGGGGDNIGVAVLKIREQRSTP